MDGSLKQDMATGALKSSPGFAAYGFTLNEWVAIGTLIYLAIQASIALHSHYLRCKGLKRKKKNDNSKTN